MTVTIILLCILLIEIVVGYFISKKMHNSIDVRHVNQNSFQNYAKFYGEIIPSEENFDQKLNHIYQLISNQNVMDIKQIAKAVGTTDAECVLKIRYLKNKRLIGDYYVDTHQMKLLPCSREDQVLLDKYKPFIYGSHSQVSEIANVLPNPKYLTIDQLKEEIFQEIKSLNQKGLLNGIKIDDIDGKIIYYTIEKRRTFPDHETVHCPNCGALNDLDIFSKVRCSYCQTIIKGREYQEEILLEKN